MNSEDFAFDSVKKDAIKVLEQVKTADGVKLPIAIYEHPGTTHGPSLFSCPGIPLI